MHKRPSLQVVNNSTDAGSETGQSPGNEVQQNAGISTDENQFLETTKVAISVLTTLAKLDHHLQASMVESPQVAGIEVEALSVLYTGLQLCKRTGIDPVNALMMVLAQVERFEAAMSPTDDDPDDDGPIRAA